MGKGKKGFLVLAIIAIIVVSIFFFLASNIDAIVQKAIEKYGSQATGTKVKVSAVKIKLKDGAGSLKNLSIGNPSGFKTPTLFDMKDISVDIDTSSVTKDPLVIEKVHILAPHFVYEVNKSGLSNVDALKKRLSSGERGGEAGKREKSGKEKKIIIRDFLIDKAEVEVLVAALGDKPLTTTLPTIRLKNLGGEEGDTPGEIAQQILKPISERVSKAAIDMGVKQYLGKNADDVKKMLQEKAAKKLGTSVEDAKKGAEGAIKNLLGK